MKNWIKYGILFAVAGGVMGGGAVLYAYSSVKQEVPEIKRAVDYRPLGVTQVLSTAEGESDVIAEFYKERRYLTPYDQIPKKCVQAFLSAEDASFFEHEGINFLSIARAAVANFLAGQVVQGGSTITQQIAKSLYLSPDRNIIRKIKETYIALQLEKNLTKEEILYLYLNQIYLGSGAYGVKAAARTYFHKELKALTVAEMALIAGLPTAPGKFSPLLNPKRARERQLYVLKRMKENGYLSDAEHVRASSEKVRVYVNDGTEKKYAPHFVELIRRHLITRHGEKALYEDGLTVLVPVSVKYYKWANQALEDGLEEVDQKHGYRGPVQNISEDKWSEWKEAARSEVAKEHFPYRILTNDGRLDLELAVQEYDPTLDRTLYGKRLKALVTQISSDGKSAVVHMGIASGVMNFEGAKWAFRVGEKTRTLPKTLYDVVKQGDVVLVKVTGKSQQGFGLRLTQTPEVEGSLYSVDAQTGQILAMVGGYDYKKSEFNRVTQAKRQMGSTFKPIIFAAAIEQGLTPSSIIVDSPIVYDNDEQGKWKPENYDEKFLGDTTLRQALINSRNVPTVKIVQQVKIPSVIDVAKRLGLQSAFSPDLSISLGSATESLQNMVHAYTAFPLQGRVFRPTLFEKILDRDGRILETGAESSTALLGGSGGDSVGLGSGVANAIPQSSPRDVPGVYFPNPGHRLDPRVAYVMTHLMREVVQYGTAVRAAGLGRALAGKTGTTQDYRDGWFVGFSPRVVTGVWVGYDDQRSLGHGETGASAALPIWMNYTQNVLRQYPEEDFSVPEGIVFAQIDPKTGKKVKVGGVREAYIQGTEPGAVAPTQSVDTKGKPAEDEFLKEDD